MFREFRNSGLRGTAAVYSGGLSPVVQHLYAFTSIFYCSEYCTYFSENNDDSFRTCWDRILELQKKNKEASVICSRDLHQIAFENDALPRRINWLFIKQRNSSFKIQTGKLSLLILAFETIIELKNAAFMRIRLLLMVHSLKRRRYLVYAVLPPGFAILS